MIFYFLFLKIENDNNCGLTFSRVSLFDGKIHFLFGENLIFFKKKLGVTTYFSFF